MWASPSKGFGPPQVPLDAYSAFFTDPSISNLFAPRYVTAPTLNGNPVTRVTNKKAKWFVPTSKEQCVDASLSAKSREALVPLPIKQRGPTLV